MEKSFYYYVGIFTAVFLFAVVYITFIIFSKKKTVYDERQTLARYKAFKVTYITLITYLLSVGVLYKWIKNYIDFMGLILIGIVLSIIVFLVFCIVKDAYLSLTDGYAKTIKLLIVVTIMNVFNSISIALNNGFIINGRIAGIRIAPLLCVIVCFACIVALVINHTITKKLDNL